MMWLPDVLPRLLQNQWRQDMQKTTDAGSCKAQYL